MGTMLHQRGVGFEASFDELNLTARPWWRKSTANTSTPARRSSKPTPSAPIATNWPQHGLEDTSARSIRSAVELARRVVSGFLQEF